MIIRVGTVGSYSLNGPGHSYINPSGITLVRSTKKKDALSLAVAEIKVNNVQYNLLNS